MIRSEKKAPQFMECEYYYVVTLEAAMSIIEKARFAIERLNLE